jgi:hypothetical protein
MLPSREVHNMDAPGMPQSQLVGEYSRIFKTKRVWTALFMFHPHMSRRLKFALQHHLAHSLNLDKSSKR